PNWFDVLTAQTSANEEDVSDQDELCANQEGNFKTPLEKPTVDSQLFSTPKVFRHSRILSAPYSSQIPSKYVKSNSNGIFMSAVPIFKCGISNTLNLLLFFFFNFLLMQVSFAKHISESLGAQINPDISWTSSFNTPPALPSTLILCKQMTQFAFVRKLFPSLSNVSKVEAAPLKNNDIPTADQGAVSSDDSLQTSLNQNEGVWQQKLPDAIEEGEVRTTVASVLDGAENVLSIFFANSSSALRKVKPNNTKRKQIIAAKEHGCSSTDKLTTNNAASCEKRAADREPGSVSSSPPEKPGDAGITQWSPLSLSEIPPSAVHNNILTGQLKSGSDSGQPVMPPIKTTDSGLNNKKRKFVYTVGTMKTQSQGNEAQSQKMISSPGIQDSGQELSVKRLGKASGGADCCSTGQKLGNLGGENLPPSVQANVHYLDMSQLHRDFAQDFSQMPDSGILSKVAEDTRTHFSPSACLSAMKQAKQKAKQGSSHSDCGDVSSRRLVSASNQNFSIHEGTVIDSGFQSAVTDVTHTSASSFAVPFSENTGQSQQCSGFKTDIHRTTPLPSTNKGNGKVHLNDEAKAELSSAQKERRIVDPGTETGSHMEGIATQLLRSANGAVSSTNCIPLNGQIHGSLPKQTAFSLPSVSASGFKTASNKSIRISSANLEKAKHLFEESQNERTFRDQLTKSDHTTKQKIGTSNGPVKNTTSTSNLNSLSETSGDVSCQLTASQKADVTELCTLLEETDSQFEFTQVKIPQVQQHCQDEVCSPQKADKELDPDFLTGIDFDDSFSSDAEKKSTDVSFSSAVIKENSHTETSKMENKNPLMLGVAFKTAGGNVLRVSKTCLSKARALFADLQENLTDKKSSGMQNCENDDKTKQQCSMDSNTGEDDSNIADKDATRIFKDGKMDTAMCQSGFHMASGKGIAISAKYIRQAEAFFNDCDANDQNDGMSVKHNKSIEPFSERADDKKNLSKYKSPRQVKISDEHASGRTNCENVNAGPSAPHTKEPHPDHMKMKSIAFNGRLPSKNAVSFHGNPFSSSKPFSPPLFTTSKNIDSTAIDELSSYDGFCTDANKPLNQKENCPSTEQLTTQTQVSPPRNGGFQTASGNRVVISSAALKKPKSLFSECDEVDDTLCVRPSHSKPPVHGPPPRKDGFLTASGKRVALSSEALQKAKSLFSDISVEIQDGSHTRDSDKKREMMHCSFTAARGEKAHMSQKNPVKEFDSASTKANQETDAFFKDFDMDDNKDTVLPQNTGFQTASGKGVSISSAALKKAKSLFSDCDEVDELGVKPSHFKSPVQGPPPRKDGFLTASGKQVALSSEALQKAKSLFSDVSHSADVSHTKSSDKKQDNGENTDKTHCGFTTAGGQKVHVSQKSLLKARHLSSEFDSVSTKAMQEADGLFKECHMDCNSETSVKCRTIAPLSSDSQKKPDEKLTVNVFERAEHGCTEHTNKQEEPKENTLPPLNGGFRTASGKGVAISSEALRKAEALLSECEKIEHKIGSTPPHSKTPLPAPSFRNSGFFAASGKPVTLSSEALQKAKALFGDISLSTDITAVSDTRKNDEKLKDAQNSTDKKHCGFTTAGGAKVHVSKKSLLKANNLLKEFADGECHDSCYSGASPRDTHKLDLLKMTDVNQTTNSDLAAASDMDMPTEESASLVVKSAPTVSFQFQEDKIIPPGTENLHDIPEQEMSCVLDCEINERSTKGPKVVRTDESSALNIQSLNLTGCTETQQKLLAQEALDCTKALLKDESLAGQTLPMTLENMPLEDKPQSSNTSAEDEQRKGKRSVEDADMTSQPPLKRRLLEEFNRTVDEPRGSVLQPVKSCPNGVMRDRRVFKYSASLHPNITGPHRTGKNSIETRFQKTTHQSTPGDSRSAHSKMPAFVPPFIKNTTAETRKNAAVKDEIRTPTAFVPPFKKQRTVVQESSSKPQEEEEKHPHHFAVPSNSCTYVAPSKKTQDARDVTALVDTTSDKIYQNLQSIELARDMQDMRIRKKKRQTIRPLPGSLFLTKTSGVMRIPLKVAMDGKPPARYTKKQLYAYGVHKHVSDITGETAESFRFNLLQFLKKEAFADEGGVQLADGGWLIPSKDGTAGKEEFYRSLCDTPGVDPKLISEAWVYNHYRWIVWKQASMEKSFPETVGGLCLTPEQVLLQLKYRYDVEVDHSRRPALRKIMEKDDTSAKTLILCVCEIVSRGHSPNRRISSDTKNLQSGDAKVDAPSAVVWLTDGWYAIKAQLDDPLTAMLHKGRLAVGDKLIIHGAQLVGSQDACSPLEAPESLMLKICANSSRPARWDAKLGFHRDPRPFLLPVSSLYSNGGPVGCVDIIILRSYPIQVWRCCVPHGNSIYQDSVGNIASLQDGEELYEAVGDDPAYLEAHLSIQQLETLHTYRRSLVEKQQAELQDRYRRALEAEDNEGSCLKRDVTPVWRLCITDSMDFFSLVLVYQLSLWRPTSDLQSLLKEGRRYKVYNLTTSDGKKRSSVESVQLTGTKKTQFEDLQGSQEWLSAHFQPRVSTNFMTLQNPEFQPLCGEVDLSGYVISVIDGQGSSPALYLADGNLNFVKVRCFSSLSQSGLEDVVRPNVLLALSNLQLRGQSMHPTPVVYAGDLTVFSTNPKEAHLQESLSQLKTMLQRHENFSLSAEEKLSHLIRSDGLSSITSPALQPQTPASGTFQKPVRSLGSFTPVSRNPPAATSSAEKDPRSLKRRRALDYLSRIPSPPPLSHLGSVGSPCVNKTFNPPRRSATPSTLKTVQTPAHKSTDSLVEDEWVHDEELAMIDTQALHGGDLL
uniref:BRCA2 DNA repair associated n=1 Tax=Acanthochromis polyacanthus TaxID=80966 RepID=A0A3Q1EGA8_9TELE